MATITQETRFDLAKSELFAFSDARNHVLSCGAGELWITVDGDWRDIILTPGETFRIESRAQVTVTALKASTLNVTHRQASGPRKIASFGILNALLRWRFPPLASFPSPLIR